MTLPPAASAAAGFSSSASTIGSRRALNQPTNQPTNQHVKRAAQRDNPKWITNLSPAMQQPTMSMWQKRNNNKTLSGERIALERERETGDDKSERESLWRGGDTMCFLVVFFGRFDLFPCRGGARDRGLKSAGRGLKKKARVKNTGQFRPGLGPSCPRTGLEQCAPEVDNRSQLRHISTTPEREKNITRKLCRKKKKTKKRFLGKNTTIL